MTRSLLLISSSVVHGSGYLDHCEREAKAFLGRAGEVLFVPYALADVNGYAAKVRERLGRMGIAVRSVHEAPDPVAAIESAKAVFIGGGNSFRLLDLLHRKKLVAPLRKRVLAGMPYMGSSAGTNVACPTIKTTNDMPIVCPPTLDALNLIPFQINPHYYDADPDSKHQGETREQRLREFHEMNDPPVLGLREGAILEVRDDAFTIRGIAGAKLFRREQQPVELQPGTRLDLLLEARA